MIFFRLNTRPKLLTGTWCFKMNMRLCAILAVVILAAPTAIEAQRKPLTVNPLTTISHEPTTTGLRFDPIRNTYSEYALDGKIEFLPETGDFLLSWNGLDETRHELTWVPPNDLSTVVAAEVSFDEVSGLYTYSYTVSNLGSSAQTLGTVYIEGAVLQGGEKPDENWYSRQFTSLVRTRLGVADGWTWSMTEGPLGIPPGENASGFRLVSPLPPGVVRCYVRGRTLRSNATEEPPNELLHATGRASWVLPAGFTIGPAPLDTGNQAAELSQLLSFVEEAERQGWLGSPESARNLRASLEGIRSSFSAGNPAQATEGISTVIQELDRPQYEGILTEGRALLEYRLPLVRDRIRRRLPSF
jgi:hypothetical protein